MSFLVGPVASTRATSAAEACLFPAGELRVCRREVKTGSLINTAAD